MSDHENPIDTLADSLFEAGREERASDEARTRAMRALGLDLPGPTGGGGRGGGGAAMKLVALAAVVGAVGFGAGRMSADSHEQQAPIATATAAVPVAVTAVPSVEAPAPAPEPPPPAAASVSVAKPAKRPPVASASAAPSASAPSSPADNLAAELAALDRARKELRSGNATGALTQLDGYVADHPQGKLATEAALLRIEALVAAGRKDDARRVAAPLLERHDMTGDRARKLLER